MGLIRRHQNAEDNRDCASRNGVEGSGTFSPSKIGRARMRANRPQGCGRSEGGRSYGKFVRGCRVTVLIRILSEGRSVPCSVGARIITSALLMPSMTRPKTVYFWSNAGCFFRVMNHWQLAVLISLVRAAPTVPRSFGISLNSAGTFG